MMIDPTREGAPTFEQLYKEIFPHPYILAKENKRIVRLAELHRQIEREDYNRYSV